MPAVGDVLAGRYRIGAILGAGGMATVYHAMDLRLERDVAVKALLPNLARDPSLAERFDREARLLASVAHARELLNLTEDVRASLEAGELAEARAAAERLEGRADDIDDDRARILLDAIADLLEAIPN